MNRKKKMRIIDVYPSELSINILPTCEDVLKAIEYFKINENILYSASIKKVIDSIICIWNRSSLPIVNIKTIGDKVKSYHKNYLTLAKSNSTRKNHVKKSIEFKVKLNK